MTIQHQHSTINIIILVLQFVQTIEFKNTWRRLTKWIHHIGKDFCKILIRKKDILIWLNHFDCTKKTKLEQYREGSPGPEQGECSIHGEEERKMKRWKMFGDGEAFGPKRTERTENWKDRVLWKMKLYGDADDEWQQSGQNSVFLPCLLDTEVCCDKLKKV